MATQPGTDIQPYQVNGVRTIVTDGVLNDEQKQLLKDTMLKAATDEEFKFFVNACGVLRLSPFGVAQISGVFRWDNKLKRDVLAVQVGINGLQLLAERTGMFEGAAGPFWAGEDLNWREAWLYDSPPAAAKVGIWRKGAREPVWGVATWRESAQWAKPREGEPYLVGKWATMPAHMLAKCARANALRAAMGFDLAAAGVQGVYIDPNEDTDARPRARVSDLYPERETIEATATAKSLPAPAEMGWSDFWARARDLGLDHTAVHTLFGLPTEKGALLRATKEWRYSVAETFDKLQERLAAKQREQVDQQQNAGERQEAPPELCPNCGAEDSMLDGVCTQCGEDVEAAPATREPAQPDDAAVAWSQEMAAGAARSDPADVRPKARASR